MAVVGIHEGLSPGQLIILVALSGAVIQVEGWMSSKKARENGATPTRHYVENFLMPPGTSKEFSKWRRQIAENISAYEDEARQALEWLEVSQDTGDYITNLKTLHALGFVDVRNLGLITSLLPVFSLCASKGRT